jgi:hypothetical protein
MVDVVVVNVVGLRDVVGKSRGNAMMYVPSGFGDLVVVIGLGGGVEAR